MSSVAFATYEDTVNPEFSSGFSGFPFPAKLDEHVSSPLLYPKGVSFATAIKWWWQVKTWEAETDLGTVTLTPRTSTFTDESELCFPVNETFSQTEWEGTIGSGADVDNIVFNIFYQNTSIPWWALSQDGAGLFYPFILLTVVGARTGLGAFRVESSSTGGATVPAEIDGETFNANRFSGATDCGFITITPASFWAY